MTEIVKIITYNLYCVTRPNSAGTYPLVTKVPLRGAGLIMVRAIRDRSVFLDF